MTCLNTIKILVCGDAGTGKTSLVNRYIKGFYIDNPISTIGVDFQVKHQKLDIADLNLDTKPLSENPIEFRLQIWDTAGQERFRSIVGSFFRNVDIIIFVVDVTDYTSFKEFRDYWLPLSVRCGHYNKPFLIAINKCDLPKDQALIQDLEQFTENENIPTIQCSAKTNNGVERLFVTAASKVLINNPNLIIDHRSQSSQQYPDNFANLKSVSMKQSKQCC